MSEREDTIERIERVLKLTHKKSITVTIPRLTAELAVSMLKAQKPRVMAYEKMLESEICFLEVRGIKEIYPFIHFEVDGQPHWCSPYVGSAGSSFEQLATQDEYMKKARCWTDRPTDERRAEIPWEGDEEECSKS